MKFTIRDLFLLTAIVALAVGWVSDHRRLAAKLKEATADQHHELILLTILKQRGIKVKFGDETRQNPLITDPDGTTAVFSFND